MLAAPICAPVALGVKRLEPLILVLVEPDTISTLAGSSNQVPPSSPLEASTVPKA